LLRSPFFLQFLVWKPTCRKSPGQHGQNLIVTLQFDALAELWTQSRRGKPKNVMAMRGNALKIWSAFVRFAARQARGAALKGYHCLQ
jgi:hypothetical protein